MYQAAKGRILVGMKRCLVLLVLLGTLAGCGGESPERKAAREEAESVAGYYCFMGNDNSIDSPEYRNCVKREVASAMAEWDRAH